MKKTPNNLDIFLQMHRLFKRLQQRNRFVEIEPVSALSLLEAHLLKELVTQPNYTQSDFQQLFSVPQSYLSRKIDEMINKGLIQKKQNKKDSRVSNLAITSKGHNAIKVSDKVTKDCYDSFSILLSASEKKELTRFFKAIADGYGHPQSTLRPGELEYSLHQRRITRCFKLLGKQIYNSQLSSTKLQVLTILSESATPITAQIIATKTNLTAASVTSVLQDLTKDKLICYETNKLDKRALSISISESGKDALLKIELSVASDLKTALSKFSNSQITKWLSILHKYVIESDNAITIPKLDTRLVILTSNQDRLTARAKLVTQIVEQNNQEYCPSTLVTDDHFVVAFVKDSKYLALFDALNRANEIAITCGYFDEKIHKSSKLKIVSALRNYLTEHYVNYLQVCEYIPLKSIFDSSQ